jgi:Mu transposase, C-terminal domain
MCVRVAGAAYSVPYRYVGQQLEVRLGQRTVAIYAGAELVTSHVRQAHGSASRLEHYPSGSQAFLRATPQVCQQRAQAVGPATAALVAPLLATRTLHHLREVQALLRLAERYPTAQLEGACQRASAVGDARLRTVRGLLEQGREQPEAEDDSARQTTTASAGAFLHGPAAFPLGAQQDRQEGHPW